MLNMMGQGPSFVADDELSINSSNIFDLPPGTRKIASSILFEITLMVLLEQQQHLMSAPAALTNSSKKCVCCHLYLPLIIIY